MGSHPPRVAVLGFNLESHRWARPCEKADFLAYDWWEGSTITEQARAEYPSIFSEIPGFYGAMDSLYGGASGWIDVPILVVGTEPAGPAVEAFFKEHLADVRNRLSSCLPLDGVYICQHGGSTATHTDDSDGDYFEMVRDVVGADVPVISTLDLHSNISEKMTSCTDVMIGYLTYPHIDCRERGEEAGHVMKEMISGMRVSKSRIRLPILAPNVTQVTARGPYGDLIRLGQSKIDADVLNISILSGFEFADSDKMGMTILVYTRGKHTQQKADDLCYELAVAGWNARYGYVERLAELTSIEDATLKAKAVGEDKTLPSLLFGDVADNPGGGAPGNTTFVLRSFLEAGVKGCIFAVFNDPAAVIKCTEAGVGATLELMLNEEETDPKSEKLSVTGVVKALSDGNFIGKHGMTKGQSESLGCSAALEIDGITLVMISKRQQCLSADQILFIGLDPACARSVVVKSEVHYRAGFNHIFPPDRIIEINAPGLSSPDHHTFEWKRTPRPIYPLDGDTVKWP